MKKDSLDKLLPQLKTLGARFAKYKLFSFFIVFMLLCGFLVFRINELNNQNPSSDQVDTKLQASTRPHIDQAAIDKIQHLKDNSVQVKTLFDTSRSNPFHE